jgi:hypothetical protein
MNLEDNITELSNNWYELIADDHKDNDCHWCIEARWSYGYPPVYTVTHFGRLFDRIEEECETYEEALRLLDKYLRCAITEKLVDQEANNSEEL